ncbi:hypothetical protein PENTCL1PPCAC_15173, partial [Pristionchus entomophagus]
HCPSQRRRRRFHAGYEKVRARQQNYNELQIRVLPHFLLVGVREACRLVLDAVVFQGALDVFGDELANLALCRLNPADRVPSDDRPVSDAGKDKSDHEPNGLGHLLHQLVESVHLIHQWLTVVVLVPEAEQHLVDDLGNHDLNGPS